MDEYRRGKSAASPMLRAAHALLPWLALVVIVWVLAGAWGAFRQAEQRSAAESSMTQQAVTATTTPATETTPSLAGASAVAAANGIRLRMTASASSEVVVTIAKGTQLFIMGSLPGWLRVKDPNGNIGWVTDSKRFVRVVTPSK